MPRRKDTRNLEQEIDELRARLASMARPENQSTSRNEESNLTRTEGNKNSKIPAPDKFSFVKEDYSSWIRHYERYRTAVKLSNSSAREQVNNILLYLGPKINDILDQYDVTDEDFYTYEDFRQWLDDRFLTQKNTIYERAKFNLRNQKQGETAAEYIETVRTLAKTCKYGTLKEELIRDRLVVGILDRELSKKLQLDTNLTLETAVTKILQAESVEKQSKEISEYSKNQNERSVYTMKKNSYQRIQERNLRDDTNKQKPARNEKKSECGRCGRKPWHIYNECPARRAQCGKCNAIGHFQFKCRTLRDVVEEDRTDSDSQISEDIQEEEFYSYCGEVINISAISSSVAPWKAKLSIDGIDVKFKLDTGADESVMSSKTYDKFFRKIPLIKPDVTLVGPGKGNRNTLRVMGYIRTQVLWNNLKRGIKLYVADVNENLLGRPALVDLKIATFQSEQKPLVLNLDELSKTHLNLLEDYQDLFRGLGKVNNYEYKIKLKENHIPYAVQSPRHVAFPLRDKVEEEIKKMLIEGVIVEVNEATEWCAPIVVAPKPNGKIRLCTDFTRLNEFIVREWIQLPTVEETMAVLEGAKVFTKVDCSSGFWQIPLSAESSLLTTFITPFGRYAYKRLPFGICTGSEVFQKVIWKVLEGLPGVVVHIDDILIFGKTQEIHDANLRRVMQRLRQAGMTLNKSKCHFSVSEIRHLGFVINQIGIKPDPENLRAISEYNAPKNVTEVRRFLGMLNFFSKFIKDFSNLTHPLRELIKKNREFIWSESQAQTFDKIKKVISTAPVLALYNPRYETRLSADASSYGLGAVLEQQQLDKSWRPVLYCSKSLSEAEQKYAQIEKEALSIVWATERLQQYLLGKHFCIRTDHKPLLAILKTKALGDLSTRLQRLRMRLIAYDYDMEYVPGKEFVIPDALSRSPIIRSSNDQDVLLQESEIQKFQILEISNAVAITVEQIQSAQKNDATIQQLISFITSEWPHKSQLQEGLCRFYKYRQELNAKNGILHFNDRLVVPTDLKRKCLEAIHVGHLGRNRCLARARESIWWPGITQEVQDYLENCEDCIKHQNNKTEPMIHSEVPTRPWKVIGADFYELRGKQFLVVQDYYSKWPEVVQVSSTNSTKIIKVFKGLFSTWGIPEKLRVDNDTCFVSLEFRTFAKNFGFQITTSSPRYPQSNGFAESAVKLVKKLQKISIEDTEMALLAYRNTPLPCGASPAQLMMGRKLREFLPLTEQQLIPSSPNSQKIREHMEEEKKKQEDRYNRRHRAKELPKLKPNDRVWIRDRQQEGLVEKEGDEPRSYWITVDGRTIRRNRRFLARLPQNSDQ